MESISRVTSMLETARDLTLEAARDASFARKSSTRPLPPVQLKKLLDSRHDKEILDGLRKVLSMSYKHQPTLQYFSNIIKNIASPNLEIKKLVYAYLVQHAEEAPDTALLSINTIQKSLSDSNPQLRALALRTMSSIRVPVISQIVALGIKRGVGDMSPYVRKAAALAIPKCYRLDPSTMPLLVEHLSTLLGDKQYYVAGAAVMAFLELCPERMDLIHPHYRSLVRKIVDMDEWGQLATMRLMLLYARKSFPKRTKRVKKTKSVGDQERKPRKGFYDSESSEDEAGGASEEHGEEVLILDPDLDLFLRSIHPLLQSRTSAVIIAVARCYLYLGNTTYLDNAIGPLITLLRSAPDIQEVALYNIIQICLHYPQAFVSYASHFLVRATDSPSIQDLKLEILTLIFSYSPPTTRSLILAELSHFTTSSNPHLVRSAVQAIGRCAQSSPTTQLSTQCLKLLLKQLSSPDAHLVASSLDVIRHLIQRDPQAHVKTIVRLAKSLDALTAPAARASIIWLVGEFASVDPEHNIAADVLRILVKGYAGETDAVRAQTVLLAAKVYLQYLLATKKEDSVPEQPKNEDSTIEEGGWSPTATTPETSKLDSNHPIPLLYQHTLLLARYTPSYDLRDRARLYRSLLSTPTTSTALASLLLLADKPVPLAPSPSQSRKDFVLGSASLVIGEQSGTGGLKGYEALPPWVKEGEEPDPKLRDEVGGRGEYVSIGAAGGNVAGVSAGERLDGATGSKGGLGVGRVNGAGGKEKTLDDWLDEESEEEESSSGEEESGEEESEEESGVEYETESEEDNEGEEGRLVK
ncbi:ARM repeat-containing protein [Tothia fuscella]|uniref:ARM repeat-containing protein n=1 Tax=Tothia fuscella TaxID=1048955 RepID=A0A9P4TWT3_9PEZI|nr:ARM repeat-containing protein [Tothia fuscella]